MSMPPVWPAEHSNAATLRPTAASCRETRLARRETIRGERASARAVAPTGILSARPGNPSQAAWGRPAPAVESASSQKSFFAPAPSRPARAMPNTTSPLPSTWQRMSVGAVRLFHEYANWLVGITWKRFFVLAILLIILSNILESLPPFSWTWTEVLDSPSTTVIIPAPPAPPAPRSPTAPSEKASAPSGKSSKAAKSDQPAADIKDDDVTISIDNDGIRIAPRKRAAASSSAASSASSSTSGAASSAAGPSSSAKASADDGSVEIVIPGATREMIREAARAARQAAHEAAQEARDAAEEARRDAEEARAEARRDVAEAAADVRSARRTKTVRVGAALNNLALLFVAASAILKITYKGQIQAEVKAAEATETAESEQLKRQVVEARMAAMQAQVEPHFLFNTLASIDHLIETDPPRASQMQKNLIALLRASMPAMRESQPSAHNLGREMAVIKPYLEILKVRMEDRLQTEIQVPDGLLSAEFPSMMIQSLVENAIKHGLEPKAEGGKLTVRAEIVHGKLAVTVADTGLGFGKAATAGTGIGLNNIRERLKLLHGHRASMTVADNSPSGTVVTLTVPYFSQARDGETA